MRGSLEPEGDGADDATEPRTFVPLRYQPGLPVDRLLLEEPPASERIEVDVLFVGAGPAGLSVSLAGIGFSSALAMTSSTASRGSPSSANEHERALQSSR